MPERLCPNGHPVRIFPDGSAVCDICGTSWSDASTLALGPDAPAPAPGPAKPKPSDEAKRLLKREVKSDANFRIAELMAELDAMSEEQFLISRAGLLDRYRLSKAELGKFWARSRHGKDVQPAPAAAPEHVNGTPFRTLGTADDGLTYFLDQFGRLQAWKLETINKDKLRVLAAFSYWYAGYSNGEKLSWDRAIEDVLQGGGSQAFNRGLLRGSGCWRDGGAYVYNEGQAIHWHPEDSERRACTPYIYQTKTTLGMGLEVAPASSETRAGMFASASALSFETAADCSRLLAWSVLAPFCGALPVRPAVFLTGKSGSGKSTVLQYVVKRMSRALYVTNATEAGIRQEMGLDCLPVINEEMEQDTEADRVKMTNVFGLMRQSFSDDSPRILKGTTQGKAISYVARSMFLYAAIRPGYEREADANRIAVVEMRKPENNWQEIRARLSCTWTEGNCASVRAFVWANLAEIVEHADAFAEVIHESTGMDTRYSLLEGILWSAHWRVWRDRWPEADELAGWLSTVYTTKAIERPADDSQGMLERIFAEVVQIFDAPTRRYPLEHLLRALVTGQERTGETDGTPAEPVSEENRERYRKTASAWGLYVNREHELCVALKNPHLVRILGAGQYAKVMARHPECVDRSRVVKPPGETARRCMVFSGGVLEGEPPI